MLNEKTPSKLNFRLRDLARAALGIFTVDAGFIIGIQIISFLLSYFGAQVLVQQPQANPFINKVNFVVVIISIINLAAIIHRIAGIARGTRYSLATCYRQAFKRLPSLILLYLLGTTLLLLAAIPIMRMLGAVTPEAILQYHQLIIYCMLSLIPLAFLACIHVIDEEKSPLQAIISTFNTIKNKISMRMLMNLSMLYTIPFCLGNLVQIPSLFAPYIALAGALWFLFCHVLIIIVYVGTSDKIEVVADKQKTTKVIII